MKGRAPILELETVLTPAVFKQHDPAARVARGPVEKAGLIN